MLSSRQARRTNFPDDRVVHPMPHLWPADTDFAYCELDVLDRDCPSCGRMMHICDYRYRRLFTLDGPLQLACKLILCPDPNCPGHAKAKSPEVEMSIAPPWWAIGWDVFCWIGHRRFARHWSGPQIRGGLPGTYQIPLSGDALLPDFRPYQVVLAGRQQKPQGVRPQHQGGRGD